MIAIPTLQQLYNGIITNLESEYGLTISVVGKVALRAVAAVQAAKLKLYYLVIGNLQKNIFVDTADSESIGGTLERFGRVKLGRNPFPAVAGVYVLQVTGTIGGVVKAGTVFKSDDSSLHPGMLYILDAEYILVSATDSITVRALTAGTASKLNAADTLTATAPIALVNSAAQVLSETTQPLDSEDLEAYRTAIINSYRLEAQGGSDTDYRLWAQDAQGVAVVYPYAKSGVDNELNLFVEATVVDSTDGKGTPSAQTLLDVEAVIEMSPDTSLDLLDRGRRPLGIFMINYLPVTIKEIDIVITGAVDFTPAIKAALLIALTDAINATRPFVAGADVLANKNDYIDLNKLIGIIVLSNPGAIFTSVAFDVDSVPLSTYTFIDGNIPYLNSVTYA
jgi:uncharacterized phage protein gp47/JayE